MFETAEGQGNEAEFSIENDDQHEEQEQQLAEGADSDEQNDEQEDDEVVVTIGDEAPPQEDEEVTRAPEWVRELRKSDREKARKIRELESKLAARDVTETKPVTLPPKPTLAGCDYDDETYEKSLAEWFEQKRKVDEQNAKAEADAKKAQADWEAKVSTYNEQKGKLKVQDFDDAEHTVKESLSVTQQGIILQGAENPALLVYALGKNPAKAKELAAITDPVKYAFAVAKLETQLKVSPRKAPPPEKTVRNGGTGSGSVDSTLEKLRAEAERTGDYSKVFQYKKANRNK